MSRSSTPPTDEDQTDGDWLQPIREEREGVEELAERDDRIGGLAKVLLALEAGKQPTEDALVDAGLLGVYYEIREAYR